ncbi:flagellar basal body rod protein FlgB [Cohnella rhizosphaerae]|uniref:Flagellar basal body rod protein FlgB n=1 Tax=Cohnella rhizosphaerae TaxID=1457232 RepID=A0A9X4KWB6_9BACL|nr:flagellar basal body rod protein FlgB [Cohnella rhizosphaerae]MDG0812419.1 flagellar basal body rod protein FlgB [Cohnella rhizosphaerae]
MDLLSGVSYQRLEGALHAASLRQSVLQNNVANVDTPNFKRSDVQFEQLLSQAMNDSGQSALIGKRTDQRHIAIGASGSLPDAKVTSDKTTVFNNSGNNVDIDSEMTKLAENQLRYSLYIQQLNHDVKMMRVGMGK